MTLKHKIKNLLQNKSIKESTLFLMNWFLIRLFKIKIEKYQNISSNKIAKKIFSKCVLKKYKNEYWYLDPMPSELDLNNYYRSLYWKTRNEKVMVVTGRDLVHLNILKKYIPEFTKGKDFLNFGAGHGGVSHLAWSYGLKITNIEPSGLPNYYSRNWKTYNLISEVASNSVDIFYGSHSVEHVQNIDIFISQVRRVLKPNGVVFWEVPNALCKINGVYARNKKIVIPHTYYFTCEYFKNLFDKILLNQSFDQSQRVNDFENWSNYTNKQGSVIRIIARFSN